MIWIAYGFTVICQLQLNLIFIKGGSKYLREAWLLHIADYPLKRDQLGGGRLLFIYKSLLILYYYITNKKYRHESILYLWWFILIAGLGCLPNARWPSRIYIYISKVDLQFYRILCTCFMYQIAWVQNTKPEKIL